MPLQPDQQIAHYRIVEKIGEGGMGQVWKALDTTLGREVALKVLPRDTASGAGRIQRFRREARALAALDHPAIVTVHSVEEADGLHFLTMSFVSGQTLDALIPPGGLEPDLLFDLALQLVDALSAAHEKGVVHRDLKPQNLMVTSDGRLKVLDFGIAKLTEQEPPSSEEETRTAFLTQEGVAVGTPAYMSPEQIEGGAVDHRTDIFSLGILLYRMSTGEGPFGGESAPSTMASILRDTPVAVSERRGDLPQELAAVVSRCLAKEPERRYQTAREMGHELRRIRDRLPSKATPASPADHPSQPQAGKSIAVLPFANRSSDSAYDYFSDGLSEELINALSGIAGLKVTARSSAFQFRGQELDVREVGDKLGVGTILEGSVRMAGNRLRITAQLINCADGYQIWSDRYDGELEDIFQTQDDIAQAIVSQLQVQLGGEKKQLVSRATDDLEAYHLYLKGRHHRDEMKPGGLTRGIEFFEQAIQIAPGYATAYAGLADTLILAAYWTGIEPIRAFARARAAAEKALTLDPTLAEAYAAVATVHMFHDLDWPAAEKMFARALELNPNHAFILYWYGMFLALTQRDDEAVAAARKSHDLDPLSSIMNGNYGQILFLVGRPQEAARLLEEAVALHPGDYFLWHTLGWAHRENGNRDLALEAGRRAVELTQGAPWVETGLALTCYRFGEEEEANKIFADLQRRRADETVWPVCLVFLHLARGEMDEAVDWLRKSRDQRDPVFCWFNLLYRGSASLNLPADPRIDTIMAEAGIP